MITSNYIAVFKNENYLMSVAAFYDRAKREVINLGYLDEIQWQAGQEPETITESYFLREAAWVVYCSGFRESVVRRHFDFISLCFCDWSSADEIVEKGEQCICAAMHAIRNRRKHDAVVEIARRVSAWRFDTYKDRFTSSPIAVLQELPFIGPVTAFHLAKNLGFDVAKPDRHLLRLYPQLGFGGVDEMCRSISQASGDPLRVVDLVLWRYLERQSTVPH